MSIYRLITYLLTTSHIIIDNIIENGWYRKRKLHHGCGYSPDNHHLEKDNSWYPTEIGVE